MNMLLRVRSSEKNQKLPKFTYYYGNNIYFFAIVVFSTWNVTKYQTCNNDLENVEKFRNY